MDGRTDGHTYIHTYRKWLLNVLSDVKNTSISLNSFLHRSSTVSPLRSCKSEIIKPPESPQTAPAAPAPIIPLGPMLNLIKQKTI